MIYLIGANSYIASRLKQSLLATGHNVFGISHSEAFGHHFEDGAAIVNCSASYVPADNWPQMLEANYHYTRRLLTRCNHTHSIVNLGSYFEFGDRNKPGPINHYASAKLLLRAWLDDFALYSGVRVVNLILYDVVGPGDQRKKLVPTILNLKRGEAIALTKCEQILTLLPVENVVQAIELAIADRHLSGVYTVPSCSFRPLKEFIRILQLAHEFKPVFGALEYQDTQIFEPIQHLRQIKIEHRQCFDLDYVVRLKQPEARK